MTENHTLLVYCRPGFENECAGEMQSRMETLGAYGYAVAGQAHVLFEVYLPGSAWLSTLRFEELIFTRQLIRSVSVLSDLDTVDRVTPLLARLKSLQWSCGELRVEYPDTNEGKALSPLARTLERLLSQRLRMDDGRWCDGSGVALHVFIAASNRILLGLSDPGNRSPWVNGIPRLRLPRGAASRSTLKLEEALLTLLTRAEQSAFLQPGMHAVDLGAAPGGWSWQLARRSLRIQAIDNAALDPRLLETGLVRHVRADGFRYRPPQPVDWLVCDMVEQPHRVTALICDWMTAGYCRHALFNLKLPMKQRRAAVEQCLALIRQRLEGRDFRLRCKQLYHDRREVTVYLGMA